jgi:hypothetical protein
MCYYILLYIYNYMLLCITMHYYVLLYITILLDYVSICCYIIYIKHIAMMYVSSLLNSFQATKKNQSHYFCVIR